MRFGRSWLGGLLAFGLFAAPAALLGRPAEPVPASWQQAGSDIPADPEWHTGVLSNGLHYAVRRNPRPAGNIAIRVRIAAGALMERDAQQGWAHLLEHMAFRGSQGVPDGEGVKIWQRLGARFGSDSNAFTSQRATTYQLDLPRTDFAAYDEAMRVLAGMMQDATIDAHLLDTERQVVLAERAGSLPPLTRKLREAMRAQFLTGLLAERRDILGTPETLAAASADKLRAFYKQWYRPDRAVVVAVGDADPELLARVIRERFGSWQGAGSAPPEPDYGAIAPPSAPAATVIDGQASNSISLEWVTAHDDAPMTMARLDEEFARDVALRVLSRRLSNEGDRGGAIVAAGARFSDSPHVADEVSVTIRPRASDWRPALDQAFGVINAMLAAPPRQEEVDQQLDAMRRILAKSVTDGDTALSNSVADGIVSDVDEGDVSAARAFYRDAFERIRPSLTPARVRTTVRAMLAGEPRLLLVSSTPVETASAAAALASARRVRGSAQARVRSVSLDQLRLPAAPGKPVSVIKIDDLGIERVRFANGVELAMKQTGFDKDRIGLVVEIGHGVLNLDSAAPVPDWSAGALGLGGIGPFTREELGRLAAGREIAPSVAYGKDSFAITSSTDRRDLADALKLSLTAATQMRYSSIGLRRLKDQFEAGYQANFSQPMSVYRAFGAPALYAGDKRFASLPDPRDVRELSDSAFAAFWRAQLAGGPIKLSVIGDFDRDALVDAVARTYGALPPRDDAPPTQQQLTVRPPAAGGTLALHHRGDVDQALVIRAFAVPGSLENLATTRALNVASEIVLTLLTDRFREGEGGTYSPMMTSDQPDWLPSYGVVLAGAQVRPSRIADFEAALDRILTELATRGPDPDQLARAKATLAARIDRSRTTNGYWLGVLGRNLDDPRRIDSVRTQIAAYRDMDAAAVQTAVARYLKPGATGSYEVRVLPDDRTAAK